MNTEFRIEKGSLDCPLRGRTSVDVCRGCADFKRVAGSDVICNASMGVMSGEWWGKIVRSALSPPKH